MKTLVFSDGVSNFILGLTGSGKSTLITSMLGGKIKYTKQGLKYII
jgi:ABC-type lipoprotein export system ATPase subunit